MISFDFGKSDGVINRLIASIRYIQKTLLKKRFLPPMSRFPDSMGIFRD